MFGQEEIRDEGLRILDGLGWHYDNVTAPFPGMVDTVGAVKTWLGTFKFAGSELSQTPNPQRLLCVVYCAGLRDHCVVSVGSASSLPSHWDAQSQQHVEGLQ